MLSRPQAIPPPPTSHPQCSQAMYIGWHARPHHTTPRHGTPHLIARHGTTHHNTTWHEMPRHATPRHTTMHPSQTKVIQVQEKPTDLVEKLRPICHAAFKKYGWQLREQRQHVHVHGMAQFGSCLQRCGGEVDGSFATGRPLPTTPRHTTHHTTPYHKRYHPMPHHTAPHHTTPHHTTSHHTMLLL